MNSEAISILARMLGVEASALLSLDKIMSAATGRNGTLDFIFRENRRLFENALQKIDVAGNDAYTAFAALRKVIFSHEKKLKIFLSEMAGENIFVKAVNLAERIIKTNHGYFLKKEKIKDIFVARPPMRLMDYLGYRDIDSLIAKEDLTECFSALRFVETNDWMHETFEKVYSGFTADDFEERKIEVKILGSKWLEIGEKFVAKKHHNVSHLKEFGVIFLNPVSENIPGKLLRDFLLFLHYFHEVEFYSNLFRRYSVFEDFNERFKSLLRGDVKEINYVKDGEWLIVQRYLFKENANDPRIFLPRVNSEAIHWARGERDFADFFKNTPYSDLAMWNGLNWVAGFFKKNDKEELLSFDIEDNAMSVVSFIEGRGLEQFFTYHQREALWTKIFLEYVGGEENAEKLLLENFDKGVIRFKYNENVETNNFGSGAK